jgi:predicted amidohydrolase
MNITTIQSNIIWEDKDSNIKNYQSKIDNIESDLIILPEMFTTGFTMNPKSHAESMDGKTIQWMKKNASKKDLAICGSLIIEEEGKYYNRFIWVNPDGSIHHYDKRHLFSFAGEDDHYTSGDSKIVIEYKGWKICPLICYDLRFPVWSRNVEDYEVLIYVANWPSKRKMAWRSLLVARAIENQCYVIGVNRVGEDGNNLSYNGDTSLINALGETLYINSQTEDVFTTTLSKLELSKVRNLLPFLKDKDNFNFL